MRIYNLSKTATSEFIQKVSAAFPNSDLHSTASRARDLKIAELDDDSDAIIFDRELKLYFARKKEDYFPLLKDESVVPSLPNAVVDSGAVRFVCKGANVMRPGIVSVQGEFKKGDIVVVREVAHSKAIAIGRSLEEKQTLELMKKGMALENLHYVGDKLWDYLKGIVA